MNWEWYKYMSVHKANTKINKTRQDSWLEDTLRALNAQYSWISALIQAKVQHSISGGGPCNPFLGVTASLCSHCSLACLLLSLLYSPPGTAWIKCDLPPCFRGLSMLSPCSHYAVGLPFSFQKMLFIRKCPLPGPLERFSGEAVKVPAAKRNVHRWRGSHYRSLNSTGKQHCHFWSHKPILQAQSVFHISFWKKISCV